MAEPSGYCASRPAGSPGRALTWTGGLPGSRGKTGLSVAPGQAEAVLTALTFKVVVIKKRWSNPEWPHPHEPDVRVTKMR